MAGRLCGYGAQAQRRRLAVAQLEDVPRVGARHDPRLAEPAEVPSAVQVPPLGSEARLTLVLPRRKHLQHRPAARIDHHGVVLHRQLVAERPRAGAIERIVPAAQTLRSDPEGRGDRVRQDRGRVAIDRAIAEEERRRTGARHRQSPQPGAAHRPGQLIAPARQGPVLPRHRLPRAISEHHAPQLQAFRCHLHRFRGAVAALEPPPRLVHRERQRPGAPVRHSPLPRRAFGRQQRLRLQCAVRPAERERGQARPLDVDLNPPKSPLDDARRGRRVPAQGDDAGETGNGKCDAVPHGLTLQGEVGVLLTLHTALPAGETRNL